MLIMHFIIKMAHGITTYKDFQVPFLIEMDMLSFQIKENMKIVPIFTMVKN